MISFGRYRGTTKPRSTGSHTEILEVELVVGNEAAVLNVAMKHGVQKRAFWLKDLRHLPLDPIFLAHVPDAGRFQRYEHASGGLEIHSGPTRFNLSHTIVLACGNDVECVLFKQDLIGTMFFAAVCARIIWAFGPAAFIRLEQDDRPILA